jgi:hypothetical protein
VVASRELSCDCKIVPHMKKAASFDAAFFMFWLPT